MFDSPEIAEKALLDVFPTALVQVMLKSLAPTVVFTIENRPPVVGGSRLGGAPDMPAGLEWPRATIPDNLEEIVSRLNPDAGAETRAHYEKKLPLTFLGQIDLAEAARLGAQFDAPQDGRLLLFYDIFAGPADTGTGTVRVLWDRSQAGQLKPSALPDDLEAAHRARLEFETKLAREYDLKPLPPDAGTPYFAPAREVSLKLTYRLPHTHSVEATQNAELAKILQWQEGEDDEALETYNELLERAFDPYYDPTNSMARVQFLGSPLPEQDDPRYDAVTVTDYGKQFLSSQEWAKEKDSIMAKAADWRLLFQLDLTAFERKSTEGTVYLLIRKDDLREGRFDRVVGVYQQT